MVILLAATYRSRLWDQLTRFSCRSRGAIIALVSVFSGGGLRTPPVGWLAALALVAADCDYLVVQARNHGNDRPITAPPAHLSWRSGR